MGGWPVWFFFVSTFVCVSESRVENVTVVSFVGAATVRVLMWKSLCVVDMVVELVTYVDILMMMSYIMWKIDEEGKFTFWKYYTFLHALRVK